MSLTGYLCRSHCKFLCEYPCDLLRISVCDPVNDSESLYDLLWVSVWLTVSLCVAPCESVYDSLLVSAPVVCHYPGHHHTDAASWLLLASYLRREKSQCRFVRSLSMDSPRRREDRFSINIEAGEEIYGKTRKLCSLSQEDRTRQDVLQNVGRQ